MYAEKKKNGLDAFPLDIKINSARNSYGGTTDVICSEELW